MRTFTAQELADFDGTGGNPAYVVYNGKVYDVTSGPNWPEGAHFEHVAGEDLTEVMQDAPHGADVMDAFEVVGEFVD